MEGIAKAAASLRKLLVKVAHAAAHTKQTYLSAKSRRLAARCGPKKAMIAVAHSILVTIYHVLRDQEEYYEPILPIYSGEKSFPLLSRRQRKRNSHKKK